MKKTLLTVLLILVLVGGLFVLTGCGEKKEENNSNNTTNTSNTTTTENTNTNTNTQNASASLELVEFNVQNLVPNTTIKELYASVSGNDDWTPNLIQDLELGNGMQAKIGVGLSESTHTYDFRAVDEEGTEALFEGVDLSNIFANKDGAVTLQVDENNAPIAVAK